MSTVTPVLGKEARHLTSEEGTCISCGQEQHYRNDSKFHYKEESLCKYQTGVSLCSVGREASEASVIDFSFFIGMFFCLMQAAEVDSYSYRFNQCEINIDPIKCE